MRFLHLADIHLDTPFAGRSGDLRERLRDASRTAFVRAVDIALEESVDAVLVAGDLFDGARLSFDTERFLLTEMDRLHDERIPVIYATGNHDPGRLEGRAHRIAFPENVQVIRSREPLTVPIVGRGGELRGRVTGVGHETGREGADLSSLFPPPRGGVPEVALLHAQVVGSRSARAHDRYAPTTLDALRTAGYDYWALGHVHLRQLLSENPYVVYPGNPQGRHPGESGPRGVLLVDLAPGGPADIRFREVGPIRWETLEVGGGDAGGSEDGASVDTDGGGNDGGRAAADTLDELERALGAHWERTRDEDPGSSGTAWMVRIVLSGATPLWKEIDNEENRKVLAKELTVHFGALSVEVVPRGVHPVVDPSEHLERRDVIGEVLRMLGEVRSGEGTLDGISADELASLPRDTEPGDYAKELLADVEGEILARLLPSEARRDSAEQGEN